jgi:hypothetical protein
MGVLGLERFGVPADQVALSRLQLCGVHNGP